MALQHLRSSTANKRPIPTVMSAGQLAINTNEGSPGLFFKDSNGDLVKVGPVHIGTSAPNSTPDSLAATALVTGTVYQILTLGSSDFTLVGASANTVGVVFTATGTTTGTGTVSGQQGNEKGEQWLDTTGSAFDLKIYDGTAWRSQAGEFVNVTGDTMTGNLVMNDANIVFEGSTADDFETTLTVTDPTADRTITLPNVSGTLVSTGDTGSVTSTMITDGTIVNADINASAEIAVSKLANGTARQLLQTASNGSDVEFTSNVDVPGTLDVTSGATFDSTVAVGGLLSANGKLAYPAGTAAAVGLYAGSDTDTGIYSPGSNQFGIATAGTSRIVVDASGNVGIGTSTPDFGLHLHSSSSYLKISNSGTGEGGSDGLLVGIDGTGNADFWNYENKFTRFATNNLERMRIDSSGNVGIGTSSPENYGPPTYHTLEIAGNHGGVFQTSSADDTVKAYFYADTNVDNARIGTITNHPLLFVTNTTEKMRIDSSGNLNFSQEASSNYPEQKLKWSNDSTTTNGFYISQDSSRNGRVWHEQGLDILFGTNNTERLRIDSSGRVGIGTSSPDQVLSIHASGANPAYLHSTNGSSGSGVQNGVLIGLGDATNVYYWNYEAGAHIWATNATERMRIDSSGNVGIGNLSPTRDAGGTKSLAIGNNTMAASLDLYGNTKNYAIFSGNVGQLGFYNLSDNTERMQIDSSGNVGIGTSSPVAGDRGIDIMGTIDASLRLHTGNTGSTNSDGALFSVASNNDAYLWNYENQHFIFGTNNTERMRISSGGKISAPGVYSGTTTGGGPVYVEADGDLLRYTSSLKYKTDVETLQDARADAILNCRPVWYRSKCANDIKTKGAEKSNWGWYGFIAEEIAEIEPRLVNWATKDAVPQEDGSVNSVERDPADYEAEGVRYENFVPLLVNLVKRQQTAIQTLEAKVAALEAG